MVNPADARFMERALFLAERGRGTTSPNPLVGAVIVSNAGVVVGQGAHLSAGGPHAEIAALEMAGERAQGATLYCTLEPCVHTGRTGPCVERIVPAGITRVVAAMEDPNPKVAGRGLEYLRAHGVGVEVGVASQTARALNEPFLIWLARGRPRVTIKTAVSADGFVGRAGAPAIRMTGAAADRYFHRQRAEIDAIAVGSGTVIADDPLLTPRQVYRERPLVRVVFDWRLRVPPDARLFSTLDAGPVIMAVGREAMAERRDAAARLVAAGAQLEPFTARDLAAVLHWLAAREVTSLLVEGGPELQEAFVRAGLADRVQWIETTSRLGSGVSAAPTLAAMVARVRQSGTARATALGDERLLEWDLDADVHRTD
jgi:diaminohydroxyphosphoribosylaminopyrimidine deaminase/5-amino-6-(5-phosphoribosylamino)uracil reductase